MVVNLLLMFAGAFVADATLLRDVRDLFSDSNENCYSGIEECNNLIQSEPPRLVSISNKQYRFNIAALDTWCSVSATVLPCIEKKGFPDECSEERSKIEVYRRFYDFICVNNNTEIKNLLFCINDLEKTILQIRFASCASTVIGNLETLRVLDDDKVNIPTDLRERYQCLIYETFEGCSDRIGLPELCGWKAKNVLIELTRTGFFKQLFKAAYRVDIGSPC